MRIRRNLTLTTLLSPTTTTSPNDAAFTSSDPADEATVLTPRRCSTTTPASSSSSCLVCVLNQSPWDVADPSSQLVGGLFSLTGTSGVPELSKNSQSLASSVKLSDHNQIEQLDGADALDKHSDRGARLNPSDSKIRTEKGHSGAAALSSLSKSQIRASSVKKEKKQSAEEATPQVGMKRRGRHVKKPSTDPNEFYYYSGFGPHWGKKRENINPKPLPAAKVAVVEKSSSEASSSRSEEAKGRDIEFVDYDDEDEYEEGRRPRKRVKARSLKSLM